jgi:uncharacterized protein YaaN involved in tellurite resistance
MNENLDPNRIAEVGQEAEGIQLMPDVSTGGGLRVTDVNTKALTPTQKERYHQITKSLVVGDLNTVNAYGSELSGVMSQNSDALLSAVRNTNGNEVTAMTTELLSQLDMIDLDEINDTDTWKKILRKIPILNKLVPSIDQIVTKYDTIADSVEKISKKIEGVSLATKRDNNALEEIFNNNKDYVNQIGDLIGAAQLKRDELIEQLEEMQAHPDKYELYDIQDVADFKNELDKKIHDMQATQYTMKMNLLQVRAIQKNNMQIANKASMFVSTVVPIWKNQLSISIMLDDQKKRSEAMRSAADFTNKVIEANAKALKVNSATVAKEAERGIFDMSTLEKTTTLMIDTVKEVESIHQKGISERRAFEEKLITLENHLNGSISHSIDTMKGEKKYLEGPHKTFKELQGVVPESK